MIKGRWVLISIALVAVIMALSTWPLLRLRRKNEIYRVEAMLGGLKSSCEQYRSRFGAYPRELTDLAPGLSSPLDPWGRSIRYSVTGPDEGRASIQLTSRGPNADDPADDIHAK